MNFNKTFLTLGLAATLLQMPTSSFAQNAGGKRQNPLLVKSSLPFGAPDFSKIQESDYLPAFEAGIKEQRANIQKIISNKKKPTFQNTILAYENSGMLLDRVSNVFFGLTSAQDSWNRRGSEEGDAFAHRPRQRDFIQPETLRTY